MSPAPLWPSTGSSAKASHHLVTARISLTDSQGAIPLGGARNAKQVEQNAQALSFRLSDEEMARLDALAMVGKTSMWQRG